MTYKPFLMILSRVDSFFDALTHANQMAQYLHDAIEHQQRILIVRIMMLMVRHQSFL